MAQPAIQTASVTVIRASAIGAGGSDPETVYTKDLVIEDGIDVGLEEDYKGRSDHEVDATAVAAMAVVVNAVDPGGSQLDGDKLASLLVKKPSVDDVQATH